jgi:hypothetical protein
MSVLRNDRNESHASRASYKNLESGIQSKFRIGEDLYLAGTKQNQAPSQNHKSQGSSILVFHHFFIKMLEDKMLQHHCPSRPIILWSTCHWTSVRLRVHSGLDRAQCRICSLFLNSDGLIGDGGPHKCGHILQCCSTIGFVSQKNCRKLYLTPTYLCSLFTF